MTRHTQSTAAAMLLLAGLLGCSIMDTRSQNLLPTRYQLKTGPYVVSSQFPISAEHPIIGQLTHLQGEVESTLKRSGTGIDGSIQIYILDDKKDYQKFLATHFPELPPRRAFFVARGDRRVIYAFLGDHLEEDLRHEATHALLHAMVGDLPLWLDEGLAEYFERPSRLSRIHPEHLERLQDLAKSGWNPDLPRLESLTQINQMSPREYSESWAWVHYYLNHDDASRDRLGFYLDSVQQRQLEPSLLKASNGEPARSSGTLLRYLTDLHKPPQPVLASDAPLSVRSQSDAIASDRDPARKRGFFSWMGRLLSRD